MRLSRTSWHEVRARAAQCLDHPFVQGLGDGSLASERSSSSGSRVADRGLSEHAVANLPKSYLLGSSNR